MLIQMSFYRYKHACRFSMFVHLHPYTYNVQMNVYLCMFYVCMDGCVYVCVVTQEPVWQRNTFMLKWAKILGIPRENLVFVSRSKTEGTMDGRA